MSDLFRASAKARFGAAAQALEGMDALEEASEQEDGSRGVVTGEVDPARPSAAISEGGSYMSESSVSSAGTVKAGPSTDLFARPARNDSRESPSWTDLFQQELYLDEEDHEHQRVSHHVYLTRPQEGGPLFVCHHGAGSSGLTFAAVAAEIRKIVPTAGVLSPDCRHHGQTTVVNDDGTPAPMDLRLNTLSRDLVSVIRLTQSRMQWEKLPDIVLVGHSLGGAVITDVAKKGELGNNLLAYAVLDVVEGSAMEALQSMDTYLATRPTSFPTVESAIQWHIRSRTIRNTLSARVCVPSLIYNDGSNDERPWKWRTDLSATKVFWENWFIGLSKKFLEARGGKLLLLAGTDRLDKELIIGQMQGKYQLQVFPEAGHFIQEDQPTKTAQILVDFYKRNDRSALVLPPKVGDLLASKAMSTGFKSG
ncbi:Protein phosphatase methylesterase 1 [Ascosphaera acerosa]|nr:Protein phosphatase methylesterase 1 [Ascosphaera acerosa]